MSTRTEQIAAVKRVIDECVANGYDDFKDDPHTFGHLTSMRAVLATLEGMAAPGETRWRHKKRGSTYRVIGIAQSQVVGEPIQEGSEAVVYRSEDDGTLWVRPKAEFYDGRFEQINDASGDSPSPQQPTQEARKIVEAALDEANHSVVFGKTKNTLDKEFYETLIPHIAKALDRFATQRVTASLPSNTIAAFDDLIAKAQAHDTWWLKPLWSLHDGYAATLSAATDKARREGLAQARAEVREIISTVRDKGRRSLDWCNACNGIQDGMRTLAPQNPGIKCAIYSQAPPYRMRCEKCLAAGRCLESDTPQNPGDAAPESEE